MAVSTRPGWHGPTEERLRLADKVAARRRQGQTITEIAEAFGISRSYTSELYRDPTGELARARKDSYAQPCVECGGETSGSEGRREQPLCMACTAVKNGAARTIWTRERCIEAIQWWAEKYGESPAIADFSPRHSAARHFAAGEIPWFTSVVERFGSWNAGLVAAGLPTRSRYGGGTNALRRRSFAA